MDECRDGTHQCRYNQICENTRGSYHCTCPRGYRSQGVGRPCVGTSLLETLSDVKPYVAHSVVNFERMPSKPENSLHCFILACCLLAARQSVLFSSAAAVYTSEILQIKGASNSVVNRDRAKSECMIPRLEETARNRVKPTSTRTRVHFFSFFPSFHSFPCLLAVSRSSSCIFVNNFNINIELL